MSSGFVIDNNMRVRTCQVLLAWQCFSQKINRLIRTEMTEMRSDNVHKCHCGVYMSCIASITISPSPIAHTLGVCNMYSSSYSRVDVKVEGENMSLENLGQAMENRPDLRRTQFFSPRVPMILYCGLVWYGEWYGVVELNPD